MIIINCAYTPLCANTQPLLQSRVLHYCLVFWVFDQWRPRRGGGTFVVPTFHERGIASPLFNICYGAAYRVFKIIYKGKSER